MEELFRAAHRNESRVGRIEIFARWLRPSTRLELSLIEASRLKNHHGGVVDVSSFR
jgi:hypothetical protein